MFYIHLGIYEVNFIVNYFDHIFFLPVLYFPLFGVSTVVHVS